MEVPLQKKLEKLSILTTKIYFPGMNAVVTQIHIQRMLNNCHHYNYLAVRFENRRV